MGETMENIEGMSGKDYTPKERNAIVYEYLNDIRNLKDEISNRNRNITAKTNFIEKEFRMIKGEFKAWLSLKIAEIEKSDTTKTAAVELDYELRKTREIYGATDREDRIESHTEEEPDEVYNSVDDDYGNLNN